MCAAPRKVLLLIGLAKALTVVNALEPGCPVGLLGTNILVDGALSVSEVEGAELPQLPDGTRTLMYGPTQSCNTFDGIITVGAPGSLEPGDAYNGYTVAHTRAIQLFLDWLNDERGGLTVGGQRYGMRFVWVGDASSKQQVTRAVAHAIRGWNADFAFAGYSSGLTKYAAQQSFTEDKIMITPAAATVSVHSQNDLTFGFAAPTSVYTGSPIQKLAATANAIDAGLYSSPSRCPRPCMEVLKVGFIQADAVFTIGTCVHTVQQVIDAGLQMAPGANGEDHLITTVPKVPTLEATMNALRELRDSGVNVLVGCTYSSTGQQIIAALEELDFSPLAVVLTSTITTASYDTDVESGWWQGEYILGTTPWHHTSPVVGEFSGIDSPTFASRYLDRFGAQPGYNDALMYGGAVALAAAIEAAGTLNTNDVAEALRALDLTEFYAHVRFNADGMIDRDMLVIQYAPGSTEYKVVAPASAVTDGVLHFPTPTWAERRCRAFGPGQATGAQVSVADRPEQECSAHGSCNDVGECVCEPGRSGLRCEFVVQPVPSSITERQQSFVTSLLDTQCRTAPMSLEDSCSSTVYVCGATCSDSQPRDSVAQLSFDDATAAREHFILSEFSATEVNQMSHAGMTCDGGSTIDVSFAQFSANSGVSAAAILVTSSALHISFSTVEGNTISAGINDDGAAGIVARAQSTIAVSHTAFSQNVLHSDSSNAACGSALSCDASVATVTHSQFADNSGAAIVLSTAAALTMQHSAVHDNVACGDRTGSVCSESAGLMLSGASTAEIHSSLFFGNVGSKAGAIVATGSDTELTAVNCHFHSNRGRNVDESSGAIAVSASALVSLRLVEFENNLGTAPIAAGAVLASDATLSMAESHTRLNTIQANPHASAGAGGIYSARSSVSIANCTISNNGDVEDAWPSTNSFGREFYALLPTNVYVLHSMFKPFNDELSALIVPGASRGYLRGSCQEHPCASGFDCSYTNASLSCSPCSVTTYSAEGIECIMCPAGQGPNFDHTGCQQCSGNNYSEFGVCEPCPAGLVADKDSVRCNECGFHRTAVATQDQASRSVCRCAEGFYNESDTVHVCFRDGYAVDHEQQVLARRDDAQESSGQSCAACAKDTEDEECIICSIGESPAVRPGYMVVQQHALIEADRRRLEKADQSPTTTFIFRCHQNLEIAALRCPGGDLQTACAEGYTGFTCGSCADGWGMSGDKECLSCEGNEITVGGVLLLLLVLLGIVVVLAVMGKYWMRFPWRHVLRCAAQPTRILITYTQVTSQLGDVLDYSFPGAFGDIVQILKPILDIVGIVFSILGPSECYGMKGYTSRWLLRVVALPLIGIAFVALAFAYDFQSDVTTARANLSTRMFFVLFLVCK
jgi:hypothetical protein